MTPNENPSRILLVCTGNTCRSPMAAAWFNRLAAAARAPWRAESAGVNAVPDQPMTTQARLALLQAGLTEAPPHRSRMLDGTLAHGAARILTMTGAHRREVLRRCPDLAGQVSTLAEAAGDTGDIPDPFGGDVGEYAECLARMIPLLERVLERLVREGGA